MVDATVVRCVSPYQMSSESAQTMANDLLNRSGGESQSLPSCVRRRNMRSATNLREHSRNGRWLLACAKNYPHRKLCGDLHRRGQQEAARSGVRRSRGISGRVSLANRSWRDGCVGQSDAVRAVLLRPRVRRR